MICQTNTQLFLADAVGVSVENQNQWPKSERPGATESSAADQKRTYWREHKRRARLRNPEKFTAYNRAYAASHRQRRHEQNNKNPGYHSAAGANTPEQTILTVQIWPRIGSGSNKNPFKVSQLKQLPLLSGVS
jgi:hypothetical protein